MTTTKTTKKTTKKTSTTSEIKDIKEVILEMSKKIKEISVLLNQTVIELNDNGTRTDKISNRLGIK